MLHMAGPKRFQQSEILSNKLLQKPHLDLENQQLHEVGKTVWNNDASYLLDLFGEVWLLYPTAYAKITH